MEKPSTTQLPDLGPIDPHWTIAELVTWLSDDSRQHDPALQHPLALIETALTGEQWSRPPSTVALIRSLTAAARTRPASSRPAPTIADLLLPSKRRDAGQVAWADGGVGVATMSARSRKPSAVTLSSATCLRIAAAFSYRLGSP